MEFLPVISAGKQDLSDRFSVSTREQIQVELFAKSPQNTMMVGMGVDE